MRRIKSTAEVQLVRKFRIGGVVPSGLQKVLTVGPPGTEKGTIPALQGCGKRNKSVSLVPSPRDKPASSRKDGNRVPHRDKNIAFLLGESLQFNKKHEPSSKVPLECTI